MAKRKKRRTSQKVSPKSTRRAASKPARRKKPAKTRLAPKRARYVPPKSPAQLVRDSVDQARRRGISPTLIKVSHRLYEAMVNDKREAQHLEGVGCQVRESQDVPDHLLAIISFSDYSGIQVERPKPERGDPELGGITITIL